MNCYRSRMSETPLPSVSSRSRRRAAARAAARRAGALGAAVVAGSAGSALVLALAATPAPAVVTGTFTVDDLTDGAANAADCTTPVEFACSLRDALAAAAPGDTVVFEPGLWTMGPATLVLDAGQGELFDAGVDIVGPGSDAFTVTAAGNSRVLRVFSLEAGTTISGLTVTGGNTTGWGGGIQDVSGELLILDDVKVKFNTSGGSAGGVRAGSLRLIDSEVSGNTTGTSSGGGGIVVNGATYIRDSLVADNHATYGGGGLNLRGVDTSLTVIGSTFSGNIADRSGGAFYVGGYGITVSIANSTITGNSANAGGAIYVDGPNAVSISMATITGNHAGYMGSSYLSGGGIHVRNSTTLGLSGVVLSGNTAATGGTTDLAAGDDDEHPPVAVTATDSFVGGVGPQVGVSGAGLLRGDDPQLDSELGWNGGPTRTLLPLDGSPLIDHGPSTVPTFPGNTFDQRGTGFPRTSGSRSDIGAIELTAPPVPAPTGVSLVASGGRRAHVSWTAPASGPTPVGYQIRCMPQGTAWNVGPGGAVVYAGSTTTSVDVTDLVGGVTYVCSVRARYTADYFSWLGDSDEGPLSDPSDPVLIATTTPPVPGQVAASTPPLPAGQATSVRFVAAENRSGAPIVRYDTSCTSANGGVARTGSGPAAPVVVTGLTKGRTYQCVVSAVNSVGSSSASARSAPIVVPAGPPSNVRASTPTAAGRRTTVTFTAPDGGPTPSRYWVQCRSSDGSSTLTGSEVRSPVVVANLVRSRTYTCNVWAVHPGGNGPASAASNPIRVP